MLDRVLRRNPVQVQLFKVKPVEGAAFTPQNVFQFLEPVVLETRAIGLLEISHCRCDGHRLGGVTG